MCNESILNLKSFSLIMDLKLTPVNNLTLEQAKDILTGFDNLISTKICANEYTWQYIIYSYYNKMHQQYGVDSYTFIGILANNDVVDVDMNSLLNSKIPLDSTLSYAIIKDFISSVDTDALKLSLFHKSVNDLWGYKDRDNIDSTELWYLLNVPAYSFHSKEMYDLYCTERRVVLNYMESKIRYI